ncbi:Galactosylgalactosylxylosylprotein 3-beta-glucuronosyltransferase [Aphelenchoides besseyi]|nr:Galactosylgalactosylxylosylprotein 3-beta-glucuronosyltransferase [Aphelenchoides besseyi]
MDRNSAYCRLESGTVTDSRGCEKRMNRTIIPFLLCCLMCVFTWYSIPMLDIPTQLPLPTTPPDCSKPDMLEANETTIFVITPTLTQTLMHISNLFWIVIEDGNSTVPTVERMLNRSGINFTYLHTTNKFGLPRRGWAQRNYGLQHIRENYANYSHGGVVYFADDDNSYDLRLFNDYIRNVTTIGVWAVGLSGMAKVEAPHVENGVITKWDVIYNPRRKFATDMAGFAVHLGLIVNSNASFGRQCIGKDPENCFLQQFKLSASEAEPFGYDSDPREVLVWHTKTSFSSARGDAHGYIFENRRPKPTKKSSIQNAVKNWKTSGSKPTIQQKSEPEVNVQRVIGKAVKKVGNSTKTDAKE